MQQFRADLHIHTSASPCAMPDMQPGLIVDMAASRGIDIIAVSDHNTAENVEEVFLEGQRAGITVLPSIEVTTTEEAHVLAIFDTPQKARSLETIIHMRHKKRESDRQGRDNFLSLLECNKSFGSLKKSAYDLMWSGLGLREAVEITHSIGGIAIASHIDRDFMSVLSQLGSIPDYLFFEALEISSATPSQIASRRYSKYSSIPWVRSSDAHQLEDIGRQSTVFKIKTPVFEEIASVLRERKLDLIG
ncbi:MAG: PHP domain-containing protein [Nitrospiraceae bacterium]|nr:PHP domain-containing protein [Nitrospiraceae bacterium]